MDGLSIFNKNGNMRTSFETAFYNSIMVCCINFYHKIIHWILVVYNIYTCITILTSTSVFIIRDSHILPNNADRLL